MINTIAPIKVHRLQRKRNAPALAQNQTLFCLVILSILCWSMSWAEDMPAPQLKLQEYLQREMAAHESTEKGNRFVFTVMSDNHIWNQKRWRDEWLHSIMQKWTEANVKCGFIVGDLAYRHAPHPEQYLRYANAISSVTSHPPMAVVLGNHERDDLKGKMGWLSALYPEIYEYTGDKGNDRWFYYSFCFKKWVFVCLDTSVVRAGHGLAELPDCEFKWLENIISENRENVVVIFLHHPVLLPVDTSEEAIKWKKWDVGLLKNRGRFLNLLRNAPQVKWVFQGHRHVESAIRYHHVNIISCGLNEGWAVRVSDMNGELGRIAGKGVFEPYTGKWSDYEEDEVSKAGAVNSGK